MAHNEKSKIKFNPSKPEDKRITICTDCRRGIFKGQEYVWAKGRGLIHVKCGGKPVETEDAA